MSLAEHTIRPEEESPALVVVERVGREKALEETRAFIAHEIKSAIGPLKGFAKLLSESLTQSDLKRDKLAKYVQQILKQSDVAYEVVNRYLDYSMPFTPKLKLTDINQLLMECLNEVGAECARNHIEISKQFGQIDEVSIDHELMAQALRNVLLNAIEAMGHGGKMIVATRQEKDQVFVTISDTGPGIKPEHLSRIFELGFTTKLGKHGAGVGLALARRIIEEAHGGRISLMNNPDGAGVIASIMLPTGKKEKTDAD
ncbi:ATP-binding protein [candidate division KSB1 bacterium]|nr:ATP-binding protein [candidate division KSB1 bacterium]